MVPFESLGMVSYSQSIATMTVCLVVSTQYTNVTDTPPDTARLRFARSHSATKKYEWKKRKLYQGNGDACEKILRRWRLSWSEDRCWSGGLVPPRRSWKLTMSAMCARRIGFRVVRRPPTSALNLLDNTSITVSLKSQFTSAAATNFCRAIPR